MTMSERARLGGLALRTYSRETVQEILDELRSGESLTRALKREGRPSWSTFHRWLNGEGLEDEREGEWLRNAYARAREAGADYEFEALADLEEQILAGKYNYNAARVAIDSRKWRLARKLPKKYGDNQTVNLTADVQVTHSVDARLTDRLESMLARPKRIASTSRPALPAPDDAGQDEASE